LRLTDLEEDNVSKEQYLVEIIKDLEQSFWDERGLGARYRTTLVGVEYFKRKYGADLSDKSWRNTLQNVVNVLVKEGIVEKAEFQGSGHVLLLNLQGCIHLSIEKELAEKNIPPFSCPCANVAMHYLDLLIGLNSELVSVELKSDHCAVTIGIAGQALEEV
jgi:hypothetical protein